ncbi:hypothetical protein [Kribbella antiqua]|uniref:hypothetical protein n=1 Tax=Kribbella antiqua TaxID=2512217 RepID=UPI001F542E56|nr:hypothetical protein [Kribbella antiqua]
MLVQQIRSGRDRHAFAAQVLFTGIGRIVRTYDPERRHGTGSTDDQTNQGKQNTKNRADDPHTDSRDRCMPDGMPDD